MTVLPRWEVHTLSGVRLKDGGVAVQWSHATGGSPKGISLLLERQAHGQVWRMKRVSDCIRLEIETLYGIDLLSCMVRLPAGADKVLP